jgi:hypothetical protein
VSGWAVSASNELVNPAGTAVALVKVGPDGEPIVEVAYVLRCLNAHEVLVAAVDRAWANAYHCDRPVYRNALKQARGET